MSINKNDNGTLTRLDGQTLVDANPTQGSTRPVSSGGVYNALNKGSVSVTADGIKTLSALMSELCQLADFTKVKAGSYVDISGRIHLLSFKTTPYVYFSAQVLASADLTVYGIAMNPSNNSCDVLYWQNTNVSTISSQNSDVLSNGTTISLYY